MCCVMTIRNLGTAGAAGEGEFEHPVHVARSLLSRRSAYGGSCRAAWFSPSTYSPSRLPLTVKAGLHRLAAHLKPPLPPEAARTPPRLRAGCHGARGLATWFAI